MLLALSEARKTANSATSSGSSNRCMGFKLFSKSASDSPLNSAVARIRLASIVVRIGPGQMALTVTPVVAVSKAAVRVSPMSPCLDALVSTFAKNSETGEYVFFVVETGHENYECVNGLMGTSVLFIYLHNRCDLIRRGYAP